MLLLLFCRMIVNYFHLFLIAYNDYCMPYNIPIYMYYFLLFFSASMHASTLQLDFILALSWSEPAVGQPEIRWTTVH